MSTFHALLGEYRPRRDDRSTTDKTHYRWNPVTGRWEFWCHLC